MQIPHPRKSRHDLPISPDEKYWKLYAFSHFPSEKGSPNTSNESDLKYYSIQLDSVSVTQSTVNIPILSASDNNLPKQKHSFSPSNSYESFLQERQQILSKYFHPESIPFQITLESNRIPLPKPPIFTTNDSYFSLIKSKKVGSPPGKAISKIFRSDYGVHSENSSIFQSGSDSSFQSENDSHYHSSSSSQLLRSKFYNKSSDVEYEMNDIWLETMNLELEDDLSFLYQNSPKDKKDKNKFNQSIIDFDPFEDITRTALQATRQYNTVELIDSVEYSPKTRASYANTKKSK